MKNYLIGIDLGGTKIYTAAADKEQNILAKIKTPTVSGINNVMSNIFDSIERAAKKASISPGQISRIGIGVPGPVDYEKGIVRICPNIPGWRNVPVKKLLAEKFPGAEIFVENDARAAGLAEARLGAGKGFNHVFYTTVSTGIGGGIILHGKVYHGADGAAGEVGHMRFADGGSFENNASGPALRRIFGINPEELKEKLKQGDPDAQRALDHLVHYLGIGLGNVATLLNPRVIVIGGGLSNLGGLLFTPLRKKIKENAFSISGRNIKIKKAQLKNESGLLGALELCR
ncbi:MAG: ROK family protein [Candidatus Aminicenantes bacterium]|nr:ROK family protein [Candidatus Aminicenantes bacterium]